MKLAVVGVEGAGKTVLLAALGHHYSVPDARGYFLRPRNVGTFKFVESRIQQMRRGEWPAATRDDEVDELSWALCRRTGDDVPAEECLEICGLDVPGEAYREAFGGASATVSPAAKRLRAQVDDADALVALLNLRDVVTDRADDRAMEAKWITAAILDYALARKPLPGRRVVIALSQSDSYEGVIAACGGPAGVLKKHLGMVYHAYGHLETIAVRAVDKTRLDANGFKVPAPDFKCEDAARIVEWAIAADAKKKAEEKKKDEHSNSEAEGENDSTIGCIFLIFFFFIVAMIVILAMENAAAAKRRDGETSSVNVNWRAKDATGIFSLPSGDGDGWSREWSNFVERGLDRFETAVSYEEYKEATRLFRTAAERGHPAGMNNYAVCLRNGYGCAFDKGLAARCYKKAADAGDSNAMYNLAKMLELGDGVEKDEERAIRLYLKAAEMGNEHAKTRMGIDG